MAKSNLKDIYKDNWGINSINPNVKLDISDYFVTLQVMDIDAKETEDSGSNNGSNNFNQRDQIYHQHKRRNKLLKPSEIVTSSVTRVLIIGSPGTGKTTLCKKLVHDFYNRGMWNEFGFTDVIWLRLRTVNEEVFEESNVESNLEKLMGSKLNLEGALFILDGWDEIQDLMEKKDKKLKAVQEFVNKLRNRRSLILTSRPYAKLNFKEYDSVLELKGFNERDVLKYINIYAKKLDNESMIDEVEEYIESSRLTDLVTIPILLDMFLYTFEGIKTTDPLEITLTELYISLVLKLWLNYCENIDRAIDTSDKESLASVLTYLVAEESNILCNLAEKWVKSGTIEFGLKDFKKSEKVKNSLKFAPFLNGVNANSVDESRKRYEFIHLTLMEFYAALYILNCMKIDEFSNFVIENKYNPKFRVVFIFLAGLIQNNLCMTNPNSEFDITKNATFYIDLLRQEPHEIFFSFYDETLLFDCLSECTIDSHKAREIYCEIISNSSIVESWSIPVVPLQLVECTLEFDSVELDCFVEKMCRGLPSFPNDLVDKILNCGASCRYKLKLLFGQRIYSKYSLESTAKLFYSEDNNLSDLEFRMEKELMQKILDSESLNDKLIYGTILRRYNKEIIKPMPIKLAKKYSTLFVNVEESDSIRNIVHKLRAGNANVKSKDNWDNNVIINRVEEFRDEIRLIIEKELEICMTDGKLSQIITDIESFDMDYSSIISTFLASYAFSTRWLLCSISTQTLVLPENFAKSIILYLKRCQRFSDTTGQNIFNRLKDNFENIYSQCCPNLNINMNELVQTMSSININTEITTELVEVIVSQICELELHSDNDNTQVALITGFSSGQNTIVGIIDGFIKSLRIPVNYIYEMFDSSLVVAVMEEIITSDEKYLSRSFLLSFRIIMLIVKCQLHTNTIETYLKGMEKNKRLGQMAIYALIQLNVYPIRLLDEDGELKRQIQKQMQNEFKTNRQDLDDFNLAEDVVFPQSKLSNLLDLYQESIYDEILNSIIRMFLDRQKLSSVEIETFVNIGPPANYYMLLNQTHDKLARELITRHCLTTVPKDLSNSDTAKVYERSYHDFTETQRSLMAREVKTYKNYFIRSLKEFNELKTDISATYFDEHRPLIDWCNKVVTEGKFYPDPILERHRLSEKVFKQKLRQFGAYSDIGRFVLCKSQQSFILAIYLLSGSPSEATFAEIDSKFRFHDMSKEIILEMSCNLDDPTWGVFYYKALINSNVSLSLLVECTNSENCDFMAFVLRAHFQRLPFDSPPIYFYKNRLFYNSSGNSDSRSLELSKSAIRHIAETMGVTEIADQPCNTYNCNVLNENSDLLKFWCLNRNIDGLQKIDMANKQIKKLIAYQNVPLNHFLVQLKDSYETEEAKNIVIGLMEDSRILRLPLWTTVSELSITPFHLDLSNTNLKDYDLNKHLIPFLQENKGQVHILILSGNEITKYGFLELMKKLPLLKLAHLNLCANNIFFDEARFHVTIGSIDSFLRKSTTLLSLDISLNYVSGTWVQKLKKSTQNFEKTNKGQVLSRYLLVNNCKLIFERSCQNTFIPALCNPKGAEYDPKRDFIDVHQGCVAWTEKVRTGLFSWLNYSNHVLLIFERIFQGQRQLITAELVKSQENVCKILKTEVDLLSNSNVNKVQVSSLQNRLSKYHTPKIGYFPSESIQKILSNIDESEGSVGLRSYGLVTNMAGPFVNCVDWANDLLAPTLQHKIIELRIPSTFRLGFYIWKHIDAIVFLALPLISVLLITKLF